MDRVLEFLLACFCVAFAGWCFWVCISSIYILTTWALNG